LPLLTAIYDQTIGEQQRIDATLASFDHHAEPDRYQQLHRRRRLAEWAPYSMYRLIDPAMTDAQRKAWNRVALELERQRLIFIDGRHCRLSPKGKKAAAGTGCHENDAF
jgi:hypothetical protein